MAWVFGDLQNLCQTALHGCGYVVDRNCDVHRFLGQEERWTDSLHHQQPELIWISLAQPGTARGTRNDKRAKRFECRIARAQLEGHRYCVVEADEGSAVWDMPDIIELRDDKRWYTGRLRWCNLGVRDSRGSPASQITRILSSGYFDDYDAKCRCGWPAGRHVTRKTAADRPDFKARGISTLVKRMVAADRFDGDTRSDAVDGSSSSALATSRQETKGDVRPGSSHTSPTTTGPSGSRTTALKEADEEQSLREQRRPGRVSFADDVDDTGCKVGALIASFPTEQRNRDKARKALDSERKAKKRPQTVEQVFEDCGSDFTKLFIVDEYELDEVCYGDELREDQHIDEQPYVMMSEFFGMIGSEAHLSEKDEQQKFFSSLADMARIMEQYYGHLQHDDVAELCGGASGTTRLLVRRGYRGGSTR